MRRRPLWTVLIAVALAAGLAAQSGASFPGRNGDIFFTGYDRDVGSPAHLYSMHADGTGLRRLTDGSDDDQSLSVTSGGGRVVVSADTHEQCGHLYWAQGVELFAMDSDGKNAARLTDNCPVSDSTPAWSPTGRHLVLSRFGELWSMRPDGSDLAKLTCQGEGDYAPVWSPDGRRIAFDRLGDVYVMDADGDNAHYVAAGGSPSFSPDGTRLAYSGPDFSNQQGIHVIALDGTGDTRLTTGRDGEAVWSPDGAKIAFIHIASITNPQRFLIETMNGDGSNPVTIMDSLNATSLDWASATDTSGDTEPNVTAADTRCAEVTPSAPPPAPQGASSPATTILASALQPPDRLEVSRVEFTPTILRSRAPFQLRVTVHDAQGLSVVNAVVQATSLRGDARATSLRLTGADGTTTLRVTPTRRLRLAKGSRLVLLVRVRRPGDGWASAISGSRLVSVRSR